MKKKSKMYLIFWAISTLYASLIVITAIIIVVAEMHTRSNLDKYIGYDCIAAVIWFILFYGGMGIFWLLDRHSKGKN